MEEETKKAHGALIGSIIIIVILIIGGFYVWQSKVKESLLNKQKQDQNIIQNNPASDTAENQ